MKYGSFYFDETYLQNVFLKNPGLYEKVVKDKFMLNSLD